MRKHKPHLSSSLPPICYIRPGAVWQGEGLGGVDVAATSEVVRSLTVSPSLLSFCYCILVWLLSESAGIFCVASLLSRRLARIRCPYVAANLDLWYFQWTPNVFMYFVIADVTLFFVSVYTTKKSS